MTTSIISFIFVLGVLIFFHELGHFLFARIFGVGVEKFSLGFGPRIIGKKIGRTDYFISAIPLGGYVKMVGEEPDADVAHEDKLISFTHKHVFKRILIVAAGPFFNLLLAVIIFMGIFLISGKFILLPTIGDVQDDTPAYKAGLKKGDRVLSIDGVNIDSWDDMTKVITQSNGQALNIEFLRDDSNLSVTILPELKDSKDIFGQDIKRYFIGIASSGEVTVYKLNVFEAFSESLIQTYKIIKLTFTSIIKMVQGSLSAKNLGGPILIAQMAGEQAKAGVANLSFFIALISINLGIINFFPIPVLDGGHLLFFFIEGITGRPVSIKMREISQQIGFVLLITLMIFAFYNDIARILVK